MEHARKVYLSTYGGQSDLGSSLGSCVLVPKEAFSLQIPQQPLSYLWRR